MRLSQLVAPRPAANYESRPSRYIAVFSIRAKNNLASPSAHFDALEALGNTDGSKNRGEGPNETEISHGRGRWQTF
jgi:hypothetical protein